MEKPKIVIDVRNMPNVAERPKKVSRELDRIESGEYAEIIADDERMLKLAPQMMKSIGKADFIKSWEGDDGFYHSLISKKHSSGNKHTKNKDKGKILSLLLLITIIGIVGFSGCIGNPPEEQKQQEAALTVVTPPDPNSIPLLLLKANENEWLSKNGYKVNLEIKLAPSGDPSAMKAMLHNKQADIGLFNNLGAAKFYAQGEKHLKLIGVHVWRGVYILTWKNITDWKQLNGKRGIAVPAIKTPPHLWAMKVLKKYNVKIQFIGMGMGQVLFTTLSSPDRSVPVVVAPEPAVTMILMKQEKENWPVKYKVFADTAKEINPKGVPLGAMIITNDNFANSENGKKDIETFIKGYSRAINEVNNKGKIDNNSKILASEWKKTFHQDLPPQFFKTLLLSDRLGLDFKSSEEIKEDLLKVYKEFGIKIDNEFFYP